LIPNSLVGLVRLMLITPPTVLRPNSVPWGPRSTSTDSISKRSTLAPAVEARKTPSMDTPTVGSKVFSRSSRPTPRMDALSAAPAKGWAINSTLGASFLRSTTLLMMPRSICPADRAVTATGTSWMDSARFRAVTTTSSRAKLASCARALWPVNELAATAPSRMLRVNAGNLRSISRPSMLLSLGTGRSQGSCESLGFTRWVDKCTRVLAAKILCFIIAPISACTCPHRHA